MPCDLKLCIIKSTKHDWQKTNTGNNPIDKDQYIQYFE